ncbi:MAG: SRPBCC family protein [Micromonosporaceae bacterium]
MVHVEGEIVIERPVEVVFDFVADERNEPKYNRAMTRAEKVTDGPLGEGTRFLAAVKTMGREIEMRVETTGYERPARLASTSTMSSFDTSGTLTFRPVPTGTLMHWSWDVRPKGMFRLLTPVMARLGSRSEERIWAGLKRYLEAGEPAV